MRPDVGGARKIGDVGEEDHALLAPMRKVIQPAPLNSVRLLQVSDEVFYSRGSSKPGLFAQWVADASSANYVQNGS